MKNNIISTCCDSECWSKNWNSFNEDSAALIDFDFENGRVGNFADYHQRDSGARQRNSSGEWVWGNENIMPYTDFQSGSQWGVGSCTKAAEVVIADPFGGFDAIRVTATSAGGNSNTSVWDSADFSPQVGDIVTVSVYARALTGAENALRFAGFAIDARFDLEAETVTYEQSGITADVETIGEPAADGYRWLRCSATFVFSASATLYIGAYQCPLDGREIHLLSKPQVQRGGAIGDFLATDGGAVFTPRLDHYDPISDRRGYLHESQATNLLPYSNDFSNAQWNKQGTASIISTDQPSPDGGDGASTLTDADNIAWGTGNMLYGGGTSIAPNTDYVFSLYIRKTPGSSTTTAAIGIRDNWSGAFPKESFMVTDEWQRVSVVHTTSGTVNSLGTHIGNADGDVDIWNAQLEEGAVPSSPVFTNGSTVTRQADDVSGIDLSGEGFATAYMRYQNYDTAGGSWLFRTTSGSTGIRVNSSNYQFVNAFRAGGSAGTGAFHGANGALSAFGCRVNDSECYSSVASGSGSVSSSTSTGVTTLDLSDCSIGTTGAHLHITRFSAYLREHTDSKMDQIVTQLEG